MKLDIKSVLIGALLVSCILLVMGLTPVRNEVGKYVPVYKGNVQSVLIIDTTTGRAVRKVTNYEWEND